MVSNLQSIYFDEPMTGQENQVWGLPEFLTVRYICLNTIQVVQACMIFCHFYFHAYPVPPRCHYRTNSFHDNLCIFFVIYLTQNKSLSFHFFYTSCDFDTICIPRETSCRTGWMGSCWSPWVPPCFASQLSARPQRPPHGWREAARVTTSERGSILFSTRHNESWGRRAQMSAWHEHDLSMTLVWP